MDKEFKKEIKIEIFADGVSLQGSSHIYVKNGIVDYSSAEEHFYEIVRKWEKDWIKESFEEEKEFIIDNLTKEQEEILQDKHADQCEGVLDDDMPDDYEDWLMELDLDDLKKYLTPKIPDGVTPEDLRGNDIKVDDEIQKLQDTATPY